MELLRLGMRKQASLASHPVQFSKLRLGEENGLPVILREPNSPVITSEMVSAILESEDEDYFQLPAKLWVIRWSSCRRLRLARSGARGGAGVRGLLRGRRVVRRGGGVVTQSELS